MRRGYVHLWLIPFEPSEINEYYVTRPWIIELRKWGRIITVNDASYPIYHYLPKSKP